MIRRLLHELFKRLANSFESTSSPSRSIDLEVSVSTTPSLILDAEQNTCIEAILQGKRNCFVTGGAGTGKSAVIRRIRELDDKALVVSPTGLAALNVNGRTMHSQFQLKSELLLPHRVATPGGDARSQLQQATRLIIDEISMVRLDAFYAMDKILKSIMNSNAPFGGKQVVVFGDFAQLSPVLTGVEQPAYFDNFDSIWACGSNLWSSCNFDTSILSSQYRFRSDPEFGALLNRCRLGTLSSADLDKINERVSPNPGDCLAITTRNAEADRVNHERYLNIQGRERVYISPTSVSEIDMFKKTLKLRDLPVSQNLRLKIGVRVLIRANSECYVNGDTGVVISLRNESVLVKLDRNDEAVWVFPNTWQAHDYRLDRETGLWNLEVVAKYKQIPISLGYAMTVYKCQGMTLPKAHIENGSGFWKEGQAYTALSRCSTLSKISISNAVTLNDFQISDEIVDYI